MKTALAALLCVALASVARAADSIPEADRALVREIYEELLEIDTTHSNGTTAAAEAMAARLRAAGFPRTTSRCSARPPEGEPGRATARRRGQEAAAPARAPRRGRGETRGLDVRSVHAAREGRLLLRPRDADDKAMAAIFVANLIRLKRRGFKPRPRPDPRAHRRRGGRRRERRRLAAREAPRSHRRRVRHQRGRRRAHARRAGT